MVTTKHYCGICKRGYSVAREAKKCEAQGIMGKEIQPGLTLIRLDINAMKFYEKLFVILGRETRYAKRAELAHYRVYRVGLVDFSKGEGEHDWDRWNWHIKKSQDIGAMLKDQKLRVSTKKELAQITDYFQDWRIKIATALKSPNASAEPYKGCLEPEIIDTIEKYNLTLHNRNPFR